MVKYKTTDLDDEAFGYQKRVIVTPAVYLRLISSQIYNIQSTGQKSQAVNTDYGLQLALF